MYKLLRSWNLYLCRGTPSPVKNPGSWLLCPVFRDGWLGCYGRDYECLLRGPAPSVCYDEISQHFPWLCASTTRCPHRRRSARPPREIPSACILAGPQFTTTRTLAIFAHSLSWIFC